MARPISRLALLGAVSVAATLASPARADQFKQAADGATIECAVSARELTRFALVGDQFASVSKITTGTPYNDFAVSNEPLRGDIYVSVPETYAAASISFFATTRKGYVYKFACAVESIPAAQIFITNPAIARNEAASWEAETPIAASAVRLIGAMANEAAIEGYAIRHSSASPARVGGLELQLIADYRGAELAGKVLHITNRGGAAITLRPDDLAPKDTLAIAIAQPTLDPGASTSVFVVGAHGETDHD